MTADEGIFWQTVISGVSAFLTFAAICTAIWVGLEPRRLAKEQNAARAKSLGLAIAADIELGAARILAVVQALEPFGENSVINEEKLVMIFHYLRTTEFPFLSRVATELQVFGTKLSGQLTLVYANQRRITLLAKSNGDIESYDLGDVLVSDILPSAKAFYRSMIDCMSPLRRLNDESFDDGEIKAGAQFFAETINVNHR